jgi:hypothetical protein
MCSDLRSHLKTALDVIQLATVRISELKASQLDKDMDPSRVVEGVADQSERLMQAEEVRTMCVLRILQDAVDAQAQELVKMDNRRRELLDSIIGFQRLKFCIRGVSRTPELSRWASAALRLAPGGHLPDTPAISATAALWKEKFETLSSDPNAAV